MSSKSSAIPSPLISLRGTIIVEVSDLKILGLHFSSNLSWRTHLLSVTSKARRLAGLCRILSRSGCSKDWCWRVHIALVRSVVLYAFPAWCNAPPSALDELWKIERRATKVIGSSPNVTMKSAAYKLCSNLFTTICLSQNHPLASLFIQPPSTYHTRLCIKARNPLAADLIAPFAKTNRLKNSFIRFAPS
jgi:hypothetical protein